MEREELLPQGQPISVAVEERNIAFSGLPDEEMAADIVLPDTQHGEYVVPLTAAMPASAIPGNDDDSYAAWKAAIDWENVLVPLSLKRMTRDKKIENLRTGCRLYIFRDGYLWRELEVASYGRYATGLRDINLKACYGKDDRQPTCPLESHVLIPFRVGSHESVWEVAFSETPWMWKKIQDLGGVAPTDPRNIDGEDFASSESNAARERRCSPLTFSEDQLKNKKTQLREDPERPGHYSVDFRYDSDVDWLNNDLTLFVDDPLQDAREQKDRHNALIDIHAHCLQSATSGPLALAGMINDLIGEDDPYDLTGGTAIPSHEELKKLLEQGERTREVMPLYIEQAEAELLPILRDEAFLIALSDYTESSNPLQRKIALDHLAFLLDDLVSSESLAWIWSVFEGQVRELSVAKGEDEEVNRLIRIFAEEGVLLKGEPLLKGLSLDSYNSLALAAPKTLESLLEAASKSYLASAKGTPEKALDPLASLMRRFSELDMKIVSAQIRHWLPDPDIPLEGVYRFAPAKLIESIHSLGQRTALQLTLGGDLQYTLSSLHKDRGMRGVFMSVMGPLLLVDMALAIRAMNQEETAEKTLEVYSDTSAFASFMINQFQYWARQRANDIDQRLDVRSKIDPKVRAQGGVSRVDVFFQRIIPKLIKVAGFISAVSETALGAWRIGRGMRSGNLGVAAGGGLEMSGGVMLLLALTPIGGAGLAMMAVVVGLSGMIIRTYSEYSNIQKLIKYGWFGNYSYEGEGVSESVFSSSAKNLRGEISDYQYRSRLAVVEDYEGRGTEIDVLRGWRSDLIEIDLGWEIDAINRELFRFDSKIDVYSLSGNALGISDRYVVDLRIIFGSFSPFNTALDGDVYVAGSRIPLSNCYLVEQFNSQEQLRLSGVRCMVEVDSYSRLNSEVRLDPAGDNNWLSPVKDSWQAESGYYSGKSNNIHSLSSAEWESLKIKAMRRPMGTKPVSFIVDTGESCESVAEEAAKIRPLVPAVFSFGGA